MSIPDNILSYINTRVNDAIGLSQNLKTKYNKQIEYLKNFPWLNDQNSIYDTNKYY